MVKLLHLDYTSLIIYGLIAIALTLRIRKSNIRKSVFVVMLVIAALASVFDVIAVSLDNYGPGNVAAKYFFHCGYLILRNLITPLFGAYIISVTDTWHKINNRHYFQFLMWLPFAAIASLIAVSPATHWIFYINESGEYTRGPLFFILYISAIFYMAFCVYYGIRYIKVLKLERFIPLFSIAPFQFIAVAIQFKYPDILCEMIASALSLLLIMITIEKPDEKVDLTTGLLKSNAFMNMVIQASEVDKPYCIVLISLSNYSALNSYLSFSNMESIYETISRRLQAVKTHLHINPDIYSLDNGMFAAVLYKNDLPYGPRYAGHVLDTLKHDYTSNGLSISVLPNVGVIRVPDDTKDIDEIRLLIKDFRNAKYTNEVILASNIMKSKDYTVMAGMDGILKKAIENNSFEVYYQPIYSIKDKAFKSAEALIRLHTIEYGFIRPDLFIPMAEESGLINAIGMIVFEKVCKFISSESFKKLGLDYIEVNLSVVQCMDTGLVEKIINLCDKYGVKPSQINLEITETASSYSQKNMMTNINTLHHMGFSFSLDDFGTGYSNMVRIASLPLNIVKLDKSFTWTKGNEHLNLILEKTISMVKNMNMEIVVEGVETKEMLDNFTRLECEYIQGYYFSKPLPEFEFINFILDHQNSDYQND